MSRVVVSVSQDREGEQDDHDLFLQVVSPLRGVRDPKELHAHTRGMVTLHRRLIDRERRLVTLLALLEKRTVLMLYARRDRTQQQIGQEIGWTTERVRTSLAAVDEVTEAVFLECGQLDRGIALVLGTEFPSLAEIHDALREEVNPEIMEDLEFLFQLREGLLFCEVSPAEVSLPGVRSRAARVMTALTGYQRLRRQTGR